MKSVVLGFLLSTPCVLIAQQLAPNAREDKPVAIETEEELDKVRALPFDEAKALYIDKARETFPEASKRFRAGLPKDYRFFVKTFLEDPFGTFEEGIIFVTALDAEKKTITGWISNDLTRARKYRRYQTVSFSESEIYDWTILRHDGTEEGNFGGKLLKDYFKGTFRWLECGGCR